jgi:hypothetical protein
MSYQLSDIFIGQFITSQKFGNKLIVNGVDIYAKWGLPGHNGVDFACPSMTPLLSGADGYVQRIGYDQSGYGHYVIVVHHGFYTRFAHLNNVAVKVGDRVVAGQLVAYSNNSGNSTAPHLHFEVVPCDDSGVPTEANNGYGGRVDPLGERVVWNIRNLREPVIQTRVYNGSELVKTREEANMNWDVVLEITSAMGVEANPEDKKLTIQLAKATVKSYNDEIGKLIKQIEEIKKHNENQQNDLIALNKTNAEISKQNQDLLEKNLQLEREANDLSGSVKEVADIAKLDKNLGDDELLKQLVTHTYRLTEENRVLTQQHTTGLITNETIIKTDASQPQQRLEIKKANPSMPLLQDIKRFIALLFDSNAK